ncbi:hypothetical protein D3C87_1353320 [compost metagenome]
MDFITRLIVVPPSARPVVAALKIFSGASRFTIDSSCSSRWMLVRAYWLARAQACCACGPAAVAASPRSSLSAAYSARHLLRGTSEVSELSEISRPTTVRSFCTAW